MNASLDIQGRLNGGLLSAQARSACLFFLLLLLFYSKGASAHGVAVGDKGYIQEITGINIILFIYPAAKHMVTGYDHLLFLFGVIFFLYKMLNIGLYVSLFAVGHSTTLLIGTFFDISVNAYLIDAIIGLSVVYKVLDKLGLSSAGSVLSPTRSLRRLSLASSTASGWRPKSRSSKFLPMSCSST